MADKMENNKLNERAIERDRDSFTTGCRHGYCFGILKSHAVNTLKHISLISN